MTEKLYYQDSKMMRFEAGLIRQVREDECWLAVLDRSAFYPEGGGQPADRGWLNEIPVLDVQEKDGEILHFLPEPLVQGRRALSRDRVLGRIDEARRLDFMQQHTGQHIVSAGLLKTGGYNTVSAHLGESYTAVEIDSAAIPEEHIIAAEEAANSAINRNLPVRVRWISREEVHRYTLRKAPPDRDRLRLVEIGRYDACACGGIHLTATGEVGLVKAVNLEKIRGRVRLHWKIGRRAYQDYRKKDNLAARLSQELSSSREEIIANVQKIKDQLRLQIRQTGEVEERLAQMMAETLLDRAEVLAGVRLVFQKYREESMGLVQSIFNRLLEKSNITACLTNVSAGGLHWLVGTGAGIDLPLRRIVPPLLPLVEGKGGGRDSRWQGFGRKIDGEDKFLEELKKLVSLELVAR